MQSDPTEPLPITEQANPRSENLSSLSTAEIVGLMNEEDATVAIAVAAVLPDVATAIDRITEKIERGGRLFYIGTGTSGRLGVLDASECPPTFGVSPDLVQGVIAGGYDACYRAVEASEDDSDAGANDLRTRGFKAEDCLVGIAASGRTPYTVGAVEFARSLGAFTVAITCVPGSAITEAAEVSIIPVVGPEVLAGSTRLKAGTAQKLVLNMLSTATLTKLGYVTGNRMSNLQPRNEKLRARALRILKEQSGLNEATAISLLELAGNSLPVALVMASTSAGAEAATRALREANGVVQNAIAALSSRS
jgi:N-acetylmuramic acid 6-phosphate etherase